ncbi:hypothetical protein RUM43_011404 [Polyplax serrata]|uniref:Uncharacterized protein n=1 Tax=Polyplax serrata TaxID=468196 RepID=A0AAN8P535_POLSC
MAELRKRIIPSLSKSKEEQCLRQKCPLFVQDLKMCTALKRQDRAWRQLRVVVMKQSEPERGAQDGRGCITVFLPGGNFLSVDPREGGSEGRSISDSINAPKVPAK